ncbi:MAG TPA: LptF/LptG family permease, partial [Candidatus Goldiibacteriota bacterium]|nr:LptF/LptG family permease [Candidatus Goldiibacteriota bacterium]
EMKEAGYEKDGEGFWAKDKWSLRKGAKRVFTGNEETSFEEFSEYSLFVSDTPDDFVVARRSTEDTLAVNAFRLAKLINLLKDSGFQYQEEATNFHLKFAFPFATFILALLGVSIPFLFGRQKSTVNAALGFVLTIIASFFYMGFVTIGLSTGKVGALPPMAAAWLGNIMFGIIGLFILSKVRK